MVIVRNAKAALKIEKNAIAYAKILLSKYDAETVSKIIWNKYGFLSDTKNNTFILHGIGEIALSH